MNLYHMKYASPVGELMLVATETELKEVNFVGEMEIVSFPRKIKRVPSGGGTEKVADAMEKGEISPEISGSPVLAQTVKWLDTYFAGSVPGPIPPVAPEGTDFQKTVWNILKEIPYGKTTTYGEIAARIATGSGKRMSAQAVGQAVGRNPVGIVIPCHRVIGGDGSLVGYGGGLNRKEVLLRLEGWVVIHE